MPKNTSYHLDTNDNFFTNNLKLLDRRRKAEQAHERVELKEFVFAPFASGADFQSKLKSPLVMPIIYGGLIVNSALAAAKNLVLLVVHCLVGDFSHADDFLLKSIIDLMGAVSFSLAAIVDTVYVSLSLVVQILATVAFNVVTFMSGYEFEQLEPVLLNDVEGEDYTESFLDFSSKDVLDELNRADGLEDYLENQPAGFFEPYMGTFPLQLKACMVIPISDAAGFLGMILGTVKHVSLTAVNLITLDFDLCYIDLKIAWHETEIGLYLAMSAIFDTLFASTQLVTRTLGTLDEAFEVWLDSEPALGMSP